MVVPDNWEPTSSGQATRTARSSVPASGMRTAHRETHHQQVTAVAGQGGVNLCKTLHTTAKAHLPAADLGVDRTGRAAPQPGCPVLRAVEPDAIPGAERPPRRAAVRRGGGWWDAVSGALRPGSQRKRPSTSASGRPRGCEVTRARAVPARRERVGGDGRRPAERQSPDGLARRPGVGAGAGTGGRAGGLAAPVGGR